MDRTRLGPYRLVRLLGRGGMAEVYLGVAVGASGFEKRVAVKALRPELVGDVTLEKLLIAEATLGARLSHRNLVQVHDLGVDEGVYHVRMDLVDGGNLATALRRGPADLGVALFVADEVLAALAYLHAFAGEDGRPLGLVHRDLSPANVLVSQAGEVKLADLGVAKASLQRDTTRANVRKGTYAYMSPEQVTGAPLGAKSDQFAFATLLHELVTGTRPFDGVTPHETMQRVVEARAPRVEHAALQALLERCWQVSPEERYASTSELRRALAAVRATRAMAGADEVVAWIRE
jgi:serine/threonine protein kinase